MTDTITRVVRALASERTHVVDIPAPLFAGYRLFGADFLGVQLPIATRCGSVLRGKDSAAVCMEPGTPVTCSRCRRITGVETAGSDNNRAPVPLVAR